MSEVILMSFLCKCLGPFLMQLSIFFLLLHSWYFITMWYGEVLFWSWLFGVLNVSIVGCPSLSLELWNCWVYYID
jgi:hypothetical protein